MSKKNKMKSLLRMINDQISLWQPTAETRRKNPKQAREEEETAKQIAEKLYLTHAIVGEAETYKIFGYGSLLNPRSRDRTMKPTSVTYGTLKGYQRIYDLLISQGTCLNVRPNEGSIIDGAVCTIDREGMMNFILREFQYNVIPVTTEEGEDVFIVMATAEDGHNVCTNINPDTHPELEWQNVMPRLDYIQACYNGIYQLAGDKNLFFTKDNVLFDEQPLKSFIDEISPQVYELNEETNQMEYVNHLIQYWQDIDSNY